MEIGISWGAYSGLSVSEEIALLKENGFTHFFPDSHNENLAEIMAATKAAGIICDTFHAPFRGINAMWSGGEDGERMYSRLTEAVDRCALYGVPVAIVHLSSGDNAPNINDTGINRFISLVDYATSKGVKIAFENQRKLGNIAYAFEKCPNAVFCWDVGHEACFAYNREFMPIFGERLAALHIHDNFGVHEQDLHMLPFDASIDFRKAAKHIANSNFCGTVMLEVFAAASGRYTDITPAEYYKRAAQAARRISEMIAEFRK